MASKTLKSKNKHNRVKENHYTQVSVGLAIFTIAIIPLLVRVIEVNYPMNLFSWYSSQTKFYDVFSKIKANAIIFAGLIGFILMIKNVKKDSEHNFLHSKPNKLIFIYSILTILSAIFSVYKFSSFNGYLERYESIFVLLSYLLVCLVFISTSWEDKHLKLIINAFMISNIILSLVGIFQYFGIDIVFNEVTKPLITSSGLRNLTFNLEKSFDYKAIYQTLYHSNYVGLYISMSFPIFITLFLNETSRAKKATYFITSILILVNLLGSISRGGMIGVALGVPFLLYLNFRALVKNKKIIGGVLIVIVILATSFELYSNGIISSRFHQLFFEKGTSSDLQGIEINDNSINFMIKDHIFRTEILNHTDSGWNIIYFLDDNAIAPVGINDNAHAYFSNEALDGFEVYLYKSSVTMDYIVMLNNVPWVFGYENNQLKYKNVYGKYTDIDEPEVWGFSNSQKLGSARGYIWSRSIPLLVKRPILGYGPETFPFVFPQNDYVGKYNAYGTTNMLVDKPHNMYIQIALSTGVFSLLTFMILSIQNIYKAFSLINQTKDKLEPYLEYKMMLIKGFTVAIFSYLISALFTDSNVNVSIVFWTILGLSYALQNQVRKAYKL